ncbi:MAG TPA: N(G),N(G)-dimethylarginine dimethylaminohydrolase [Kribbella sp.]
MAIDRVLVRRPGPRLADGLVTHIERVPVDMELAGRQWAQYVEVLAASGWFVVEVPEIDECPDGVFIEDTMVVYRDQRPPSAGGGVGALAVIARSGAVERRPEAAEAERVIAAQGYRVERITEPGTLDGGDVLKVGSTVYAGLGGRTNQAGIDQLRRFLEPLGADVIAVPVSKVLHLKSAVTALPDGTVIGYEPLVDDPAAFESYLSVPEEAGSHVVLLGEGRLLMAASAPRSAELFRRLGYTPVVVDLSEFEKLEGCVTCLSVRLRS